MDSSTRKDMLRAWARHDADAYRAFAAAVHRQGITLSAARVLDLGCGSNAPMSVTLHSQGVRVTGADQSLGHRWGLGLRPSRYAAYVREAGLARTLRKIAGEAVYDRIYFSTLAEAVGVPLHERGLDLREMPVTALAFESSTFDVIHSNATWEHVADVPAANRELVRVLRPGGVAYVEVHLFPSLSGGHDLPWIVPGKTDLYGMVPWGHLRDPQWRAPVFLNRYRERDYRRMFEETPGAEVVEWRTEYTEGRELVTPQILEELSDYTIDDLTRRSVITLIRRKK
jgi:SAM-dependent methyltransferase